MTQDEGLKRSQAAGREKPSADFRGLRVKLPDEAFALVEGPSQEPHDLIEESIWNGIVHLPDDVSLRTTDHHGASLKRAYQAWGHWIGLVLDAQGLADDVSSDALAVAALNAVDDFQASINAALTGFYRQAIGTLRSVIESMLAAACFKKLPNQQAELRQWLSGHEDRRFIVSQKRKQLARVAPFDRFERDDNSLLNKEGWLACSYELLCAFVHGRPALIAVGDIVLETTNAGLWDGSNGPIYVSRAFAFWELIFFDTMLLVLLLSGLSDERLARIQEPHDIPFGHFLDCLMEWHPSPGPPPTATAIAEYLFRNPR